MRITLTDLDICFLTGDLGLDFGFTDIEGLIRNWQIF